MLQALPADTELPLRVLDIGAGDGAVASVVLDRYPRATALLIDFSEPMMERGRDLLSRFGDRYRYVFWDMNDGDWPAELAGPFDAAVSAVAIHHLTNPRKAWLSAQIISRLVPGGVFANYDLFRIAGAEIAADDVHTLTCATLGEAEGLLAEAGYIDLVKSCFAPRPKGEVMLLVGRKP
jgi:SAM-dependent methyltransferase